MSDLRNKNSYLNLKLIKFKDTNLNYQEGSTGLFVWDLFKILALALVIIIPFRMFVAEPFVVSGESMLPNFKNNDYLIVDRITYRNSDPQRGDVVVLKYPKDPRQYFIKRVIGLPGERVNIEKGNVIIFNDQHPEGMQLNEQYLRSPGQTVGRNEAVTLGTDQYYVLGDNRTGSSDSRIWGILPEENIVGKAWLRVFPLRAFGRVEHETYDNN